MQRRGRPGAACGLNPDLPSEALYDARRATSSPEGAALESHSRAFREVPANGANVACGDGPVRGALRFQRGESDQPRPAGSRLVGRGGPRCTPARHHAASQRAAAGSNRAKKPLRPGHRYDIRMAAAPDAQKQAGDPALRERDPSGFRPSRMFSVTSPESGLLSVNGILPASGRAGCSASHPLRAACSP